MKVPKRKNNKKEIRKKGLKTVLWREAWTKCGVLFGIAAFYGLLTVLKIGCPIRFFTGISCAGCGMTRAVLAILRLDFAAALRLHPLVFTTPLLLFFFLFGGSLPKKPVKWFWISAVFLFGGVYLIRMVSGDPIVTADLSRGFFCRLSGLLP